METNKVSLKQLIEKKLEKDGKKTAVKDIYIESLGGSITFNNPSDAARIEYSAVLCYIQRSCRRVLRLIILMTQ